MQTLLVVITFGLCFAGMAIGLIFAKKVLRKGCSDDPDSCKCRAEGTDPSQCGQ